MIARDSASGQFVSTRVKTIDELDRIQEEADRAVYRNVRHAAFSIAKAARASIIRSKKPSAPGQPPRTRAGRKGIRRAIRVGMESRDEAVVGTMYSAFGTAGGVLEHGGRRCDTTIEARPFMGPALESNLDRFANSFEGSIGD